MTSKKKRPWEEKIAEITYLRSQLEKKEEELLTWLRTEQLMEAFLNDPCEEEKPSSD